MVRLAGDEKGGFKLSNSKPCKHCIEKLRSFGVKKIAYSVSGGIIIEKLKDIDNRPSSGNRAYPCYHKSPT